VDDVKKKTKKKKATDCHGSSKPKQSEAAVNDNFIEEEDLFASSPKVQYTNLARCIRSTLLSFFYFALFSQSLTKGDSIKSKQGTRIKDKPKAKPKPKRVAANEKSTSSSVSDVIILSEEDDLFD
jgi:hypothetical protein